LQSIDPHLLLLIFLPTIGFSAGIGQEPHLLRKNWGQVGHVSAASSLGVVAHMYGRAVVLLHHTGRPSFSSMVLLCSAAAAATATQ
jgi:hypothetical protein